MFSQHDLEETKSEMQQFLRGNDVVQLLDREKNGLLTACHVPMKTSDPKMPPEVGNGVYLNTARDVDGGVSAESKSFWQLVPHGHGSSGEILGAQRNRVLLRSLHGGYLAVHPRPVSGNQKRQ